MMKHFDPKIHHRRSIRLKGYDYSQAGAYFVTMATQGRQCFFGEVRDGGMQLNPPGQMVERWWVELPHKFPTVGLGEYAIMPNHFHGVIIIHPEPETEGAHGALGAHTGAPVPINPGNIVGADLCVGPVARADPISRADADVNAQNRAHTQVRRTEWAGSRSVRRTGRTRRCARTGRRGFVINHCSMV